MMNSTSFKIGKLAYMLSFTIALSTGCKKLVTIDQPISSITTEQVFSNDANAKAAMAGVYTAMINGTSPRLDDYKNSFASGLTTQLMGKMADEMVPFYSPDVYSGNKITASSDSYGPTAWTTAYSAIYGCNAIIQGIAASNAPGLHSNLKVELTAEAKFLRAFSYLYLVSYFGDVPLNLTVDFNQVLTAARTPKAQIYQQIVQDLTDAQADLPADYTYGSGQRVVPNKYAATALLARVNLYMGKYADAAALASTVIANSSQYSLVPDLDGVFSVNSPEAIWQLQQNVNSIQLGNATPEGASFIPYGGDNIGSPNIIIAPELLNSFEPNDKRRYAWIDSTDNSIFGQGGGWFYYPHKYKTGNSNYAVGAAATEYYMVLRLAEQYLIRAEAEAKGAAGGSAAAIQDLNIIRQRAGLKALSNNISSDLLWKAIAHERQDELFCEFGHRWLDLIRMGLAHNALADIARKKPWPGDYQFLFPVPISEIKLDHNLVQNPGYHN